MVLSTFAWNIFYDSESQRNTCSHSLEEGQMHQVEVFVVLLDIGLWDNINQSIQVFVLLEYSGIEQVLHF